MVPPAAIPAATVFVNVSVPLEMAIPTKYSVESVTDTVELLYVVSAPLQ